MFEIESKYHTETNLSIIENNYKILHFDEFPILFSGTNLYGNKIIGSFVFEDEENDVFRYLHLLITNKEYFDFISNKITYLSLVINCKNIFIIDKDINNNILNTYNIPLSVIPLSYLPSENSYCPIFESEAGSKYSFSLKGKDADKNEALIPVVTNITQSVSKIFNNAIENLKKPFSDTPEFRLIPATAASYKINFKINFKNDLFNTEEKAKKFIFGYMEYVFNYLSDEAEKLLKLDVSDAEKFILLENSLKQIYSTKPEMYNEEYKKEFVNNLINSADDLEKVVEQIGKGFDAIEFSSFNEDNNQSNVVSYLDRESVNKINTLVETITSKTTEVDEDYKEYNIQIYSINTDTRKGTAHIFNEKDATVMDKPQIFIEGKENIVGTIFTESLHKNKWIMVHAKAKRNNDKFRHLTITFLEK